MTTRHVRDLSEAELETAVRDAGGSALHVRQLTRQLWVRGILDFAEATDLPARLRDALAGSLRARSFEVRARSDAADGTTKLLLELFDGETIEIVLIPEGGRMTLCMSSQVGCPVACVFCASGLLGVRRNLTSAEIVDQFLLARSLLDDGQLTNLVIMGLGEPMLNRENLEAALARISDPDGLRFSPRRITVSTSGYPDRIRAFARTGRPYQLAVSLHAADPSLRKQLVPTATAEPGELVAAAIDYAQATGREATFEVVLLAGRNDDSAAANALIALLRDTPCCVNLIPWNPVSELRDRLASPSQERVRSFRDRLVRAGINTTLRRRRGADENAACGQLRLRTRTCD